MVVKILKSSANFEGVDYSERKNDKGKSELLMAKNFEALGSLGGELKKSDYINYMKAVCSLNDRVKNKQFHAIISTKGQEHSPEQLRDIAVQYLEKMGYGNNPFLIYAHSDTSNNHVHIVSTRVGKDGAKINDKYERIRSQKAISEILEISPENDAKKAIKDALSYNFQTLAQFKMLLETKGYKITEEANKLHIIKFGSRQAELEKGKVSEMILVYHNPQKRIAQLKSIFSKYKPGFGSADFVKFMKDKFGVELLMHTGKSHKVPYGYTIIDHAGKNVFKGSQIMDIKELLNESKGERIAVAKELTKEVSGNDKKFSDLKKELKKYGIRINYQGQLSFNGDNQVFHTIDKASLRILKYNDRVGEAAKYNVTTEEEKKALARYFFVDPKDLTISKNGIDKDGYIVALEAIKNYSGYEEGLKNSNLGLFRHNNNYFVHDGLNNVFTEIPSKEADRLGIGNVAIDLGKDKQPMLDTGKQDALDHGAYNALYSLLSNLHYQEESDLKRKDKKKSRKV